MPPSRSPGSSGGYGGGDGGGVVGARLRGSGAARSQSPPAIRQPTDSEPATDGCLGRSVQARLFNGVVGQQREESRLQNTVPLLPKKSGALCNPRPAIFGFYSLQTSPSHPTSSILLLPTSSPSQLPHPPRLCPQNCKINHLIPPRSRFFFPLSLLPLPRPLSRLNLCEVSPLPLLSGTAASSRSDFPHFPSQNTPRCTSRSAVSQPSPSHPLLQPLTQPRWTPGARTVRQDHSSRFEIVLWARYGPR